MLVTGLLEKKKKKTLPLKRVTFGIWTRLAHIKQLAWPMAERQIEYRKSCLVLSVCFPVVNWRSRPVAKSAYYMY